MAKLIFLPIADRISSGTYLQYDGACGTGGMLTVAEETLRQLAAEHGKEVATHLYGQEINAETYAICHLQRRPAAKESRGRGRRQHRGRPEALNAVERRLPGQRGVRLLEGDGRAPLRIKGADPNRAYKAAEIKKLKETGERSDTAPPVIRTIHKREQTLIRCAAGSRRPSTAGPPWWQRRYELEPRLPLTAPLVFYQGAEPCPHGRTAKLAGPSDDGLARASRRCALR